MELLSQILSATSDFLRSPYTIGISIILGFFFVNHSAKKLQRVNPKLIDTEPTPVTIFSFFFFLFFFEISRNSFQEASQAVLLSPILLLPSAILLLLTNAYSFFILYSLFRLRTYKADGFKLIQAAVITLPLCLILIPSFRILCSWLLQTKFNPKDLMDMAESFFISLFAWSLPWVVYFKVSHGVSHMQKEIEIIRP